MDLQKAHEMHRQGLLDEARIAYLAFLEKNPHSAEGLFGLGVLYAQQNQLDQAIATYQEALLHNNNFLEAYYNLGLAFRKQSRWAEAISSFQQVVKRAITHPAANFQLGILFLEAGQLSDALTHLHRVEQSHPEHFETQSNLATAYFKAGNLVLAKTHYLNALDIEPHDTQILFNLGVICMQQGYTDKAIQYYQQAVREDPHFFAAHNNLGVAFLIKNHIPFALEHFQKALAIEPHNTAIDYTVRILSQDSRLVTSPPDYIKNLFNAYADHYDEHLLQSLDYHMPTLLLDAIKKVRTLKKHAYHILDLGCGTGLCGEVVKPFAKKLVGVDLAENMLAVAKNKQCYDELISDDLMHFLTTQKDQYDIIVAGDVLVYTGELKEIIAAVVKTLAPKGIFVFNTEISEKGTFQVSQSGRFSHAKTYIEQLARQHDLTIALYDKVITRQQHNQPVYGHLFVLMINSHERR